MSIHQPEPRPSKAAEDGYAVWYFVGATFLFAGATTAFTNDQIFLGVIGFVAGALVAAAGAWSWRRAYVAQRAVRAAAPPRV